LSVRALLLFPLLALASPAFADERTVMVSGFERVRVEGPFTVTVTTGARPRARIAGDPRALDKVTVRSESGVLVVAAGVNGWGERPTAKGVLPEVIVSTRTLRAAAVRGGGTLNVDRMEGARVDVALSGSGAIAVGVIDAERVDASLYGTGALKVAGRVLDARFTANGPGRIDAAALDATTLLVNAQGLGSGAFAARATASVNASGNGTIAVAGAPTCTIRGSAPVTCGRTR
jgi:hypothetical protein